MLDQKTWEKLSTASAGDYPGLAVIRLHPENGFDVYAARDLTTGHRLVLLNSTRAEVRQDRKLPKGRGFGMRVRRQVSGSAVVCSLQLRLTDAAYSDVFDVVGNDAIASVLRSRNDEDAVEAFIGKIAEWQAFLDRLSEQGLGAAGQMGLLGELFFLGEIVIGSMSPDLAVASWTGPDAANKDFQFCNASVEVKVTASKQPARMHISSERQLDQTGTPRLFLFCLLVDRIASGTLSLPDMVANVRRKLAASPQSSLAFSQRLVRTGYLDSDVERYTQRYDVRSRLCFEVKDGFPRIIETGLTPGVGDVTYSVGLAECEPFGISEPKLVESIAPLHP